MAYEMTQKELKSLIPYASNSRTHTVDQVKQIASSIKEFGFTNPILIDEDGGIIAGHGRALAAEIMGLEIVPCIVLAGLTEAQKKAYIIADNQLAMNAGWDLDLLKLEIEHLQEIDFNVELLGFDDDFLDGLLEPVPTKGLTDEEEVPEIKGDPVSVRGDVWLLGGHRVMCGDSVMIDDIEKLIGDERSLLLHADPPYGMGKESDGVVNDNLYNDKLDDFQMDWWTAWRSFLVDNASIYIWGNPPDLWRLWYNRLAGTEKLEVYNQIVWDKNGAFGINSPEKTIYPTATEHCLFMKLGEQFIGNVNTEDYPEEYEAVRAYLAEEAEAVELKPKQIKEICGCQMYSHWFTKSQFTLIPEKHYKKLQEAYPDNFQKPHRELQWEWDKIKGKKSSLGSRIDSMRSYFDNTHENMTDVWKYSRVAGEERHQHATPKPVAMMERVMKTSLPPKAVALEPFGGSGSTLMGAEKAGRLCFTMELQPFYVDVMVKRWENYTGRKAIHEESGKTFEEMDQERQSATDGGLVVGGEI